MFDILVELLNTSRLFNGFTTLGMQIGSRYAFSEIPANMENVFSKRFFKRMFVFFLTYMAFRDVKMAIFVSLIFIIVFNYLLNDKSKVYIGDYIGIERKNEEDNNKVITAAELENAKKIIEIYNQNLENNKIKL